MSIYWQVESDWILNTCFRPSDPVLVCLLDDVISAQREDIDAAASSHFSSVRFSPAPVAHLAFTLPSCAHTHSYTHIHTHTSHTLPRAPSPSMSPDPYPSPPPPNTPTSPMFARLTSSMFRWNVPR